MDTDDDPDRAGRSQRAEEPGDGSGKKERLEAERPTEQREGISAARRGGPAAESDRPENHPPHPQDVNEIDYGKRKS